MSYGSLNNLLAGSSETVPVVGMGATMVMWTDRHAYTVVEVLGPDKIVVQEDNARRTDSNGMSESQSYEFTPNPAGEKHVVTRRKNGRWVKQGEPMKNGQRFTIGERDEYYDYNF